MISVVIVVFYVVKDCKYSELTGVVTEGLGFFCVLAASAGKVLSIVVIDM